MILRLWVVQLIIHEMSIENLDFKFQKFRQGLGVDNSLGIGDGIVESEPIQYLLHFLLDILLPEIIIALNVIELHKLAALVEDHLTARTPRTPDIQVFQVIG